MRASGIMFVCNGKVLLTRRAKKDSPMYGMWGFPGGWLEDGESAEDAARRECLEETRFDYQGPMSLWTRAVTPDVDFTSFLARVDEEFVPTLNEENDAWQWVHRTFAQDAPLLHPGDRIAMRRFDLDELGVAKAMIAGELSSPQYYENLMLCVLRITGTGGSYRPAHDEYVWRDPSLYMNPEFLERCAGLPVIFRHPEKTMLNTEEFRDRIVGTIFVPYFQGDEVWGVAKILDMQAAKLLEKYQMSTSPAVLCFGKKAPMEDGKAIMIENKPHLLDHLAILIPDPETRDDGAGVWDRGQGLTGVESIDAREYSEESDLDVIANAIMSMQIEELVQR